LRHDNVYFRSSSAECSNRSGESREQDQAAEEKRQALSQIAALPLGIIDAQRGEIMLRRV
jgi:hypothetical protein